VKVSKLMKLLAGCALVGFSVPSMASTVYDNTTTTFSIAPTNSQNYAGTIDGVGFDLWTINLTRTAGLMVDVTTAQDTGLINPQDMATALSTLDNITHVDLLDGSMNILGGADAVYSLINYPGGTSSLTSSVFFSVAQQLMPGTYYLKVLGDVGTAYSGTVSAVPLPGAALLFGTALLGAGVIGRKKLAGKQVEAMAA
jgi:hypothetical protein